VDRGEAALRLAVAGTHGRKEWPHRSTPSLIVYRAGSHAIMAKVGARNRPTTKSNTKHRGTMKSPPDAILGCQRCHQVNFLGGVVAGETAPRLAGQTREYLVDPMPSFANGQRDNNALCRP
jgi:cytochrome c553